MQYLHALLSANREQKEKTEKERRKWEAKSLPFQRGYAFAFAFLSLLLWWLLFCFASSPSVDDGDLTRAFARPTAAESDLRCRSHSSVILSWAMELGSVGHRDRNEQFLGQSYRRTDRHYLID